MTKGYVYILTNPVFKMDCVKIGMTAKEPDVRADGLDNTAVPLPYEVYATLKTSKYKVAEKVIHSLLDKLTDKRVRPNREFFYINPEEAYSVFEDVSKLLDDAELCSYKEDDSDSDNSLTDNHKHRSPTRFDYLHIPIGTKLQFKGNPNLDIQTSDNKNQLLYDGKQWSVRTLCVHLLGLPVDTPCNGYPNFLYNGKSLYELRKELEERGEYGLTI